MPRARADRGPDVRHSPLPKTSERPYGGKVQAKGLASADPGPTVQAKGHDTGDQKRALKRILIELAQIQKETRDEVRQVKEAFESSESKARQAERKIMKRFQDLETRLISQLDNNSGEDESAASSVKAKEESPFALAFSEYDIIDDKHDGYAGGDEEQDGYSF